MPRGYLAQQEKMMTAEFNVNVNGFGLERAFDVLLDTNQRMQKENELLRQELMRHSSGALQIRLIERSLGMAYRGHDLEGCSTHMNGQELDNAIDAPST